MPLIQGIDRVELEAVQRKGEQLPEVNHTIGCRPR
jgi:hypothetical protein